VAVCVILGTLAAFGALCAVWTVLGWLLPGLKGCALVCMGTPEEEILTRYRLLQGMGLLDCPLLVVTDTEEERTDIEICGGKDLLSRLEWERKRFDGTGNGDHSGHYQRGGVSEL
jgi:hypothetical protein